MNFGKQTFCATIDPTIGRKSVFCKLSLPLLFVCWLVGWFMVGWLVGWFVGWLVFWLINWFFGWLISFLVG